MLNVNRMNADRRFGDTGFFWLYLLNQMTSWALGHGMYITNQLVIS